VVHALHGVALDGQAQGRIALFIQIIDQLEMDSKTMNRSQSHDFGLRPQRQQCGMLKLFVEENMFVFKPH
jgi:hypothetical protein